MGVPISGRVNNSYCFNWPNVRNDSRDAYWEFSPLEQKTETTGDLLTSDMINTFQSPLQLGKWIEIRHLMLFFA